MAVQTYMRVADARTLAQGAVLDRQGLLRRRVGRSFRLPGPGPDIIIQPLYGTIYSKCAAKVAEHGGFTDDTHVLLVAANPSFEDGVVDDRVENKQVAPTILRALGLDKLKGARAEHTSALPGLDR